MLFKTTLVAIVAALLAGGLVYYGDDVEHEPREVRSRHSVTYQATPNWFQDFMKRAQGVLPDRSDDDDKPEPDEKPEPEADETPQDNPRGHNNSGDSDEPIRYYKFRNGKFTEIDSIPRTVFTPDAVNPDASQRIQVSIDQTEQIRDRDLRDRAYLGIVEFALSENLFSEANSAMLEIRQTALRDTARSQIAISYAKIGDADAAFAQIDDVEVDELRDVMRLQVIEALIRPRKINDE